MPLFESAGRILVTGASGFIGFHVAERLARAYDVYYTYHRHPLRIEHASGFRVPLESEPRFCQIISEFKPSVVIHAAALTDRALCQRDWNRAYAANILATQQLYELVSSARARMVFLSCADVFDGVRGNYAETDEPFPRSRYGKTKALAEENILEGRLRGHVVIRCSIPFGWGIAPSRGFLGQLADAARAAGPFRLRKDVTIAPVYVSDLVTAIEKIIRQAEGGLFHVAGSVALPEVEFGRLCARHLGLSQDTVQPYASPDEDPSGRPPGDISLDARKALRLLDWQPTPLEEGLRLTKAQIDRAAGSA